MARRVCPNWQQPEGDAHYRDVRKTISDAYLAGELAGIQKGLTEAVGFEPEFEFEAQFDMQTEINAYRQGFEAYKFAIIAARDAKTLAAKEGK